MHYNDIRIFVGILHSCIIEATLRNECRDLHFSIVGLVFIVYMDVRLLKISGVQIE